MGKYQVMAAIFVSKTLYAWDSHFTLGSVPYFVCVGLCVNTKPCLLCATPEVVHSTYIASFLLHSKDKSKSIPDV